MSQSWRLSWTVLAGLSALLAGALEAGAPGPPRAGRAVAPLVGPIPPTVRPLDPGQARELASATVQEQIDACVTADMHATSSPGAAVAVILDGQVLYEQGYGVKNQVTGGAVGPRTVFRIGSVTKQMTAAAVMQQVEAGRLSLDDPLGRFLDTAVSSTIPGAGLTVRHLLNHVSGIPDLGFDLNGRTDDGAIEAWAAENLPLALWSPPGAFWNYSNPNFVLAGLVAEKASGVPYRTLVQTRVFDAAGMTATTFDPQRVLACGDHTWGHSANPYTGRQIIYGPADYDNAAIAPAGYAFSNAPDLVTWALLLMDGGGQVLSPVSVDEMLHTRVGMDYRSDQSYGFGIFREEYGGLEVFEHNGFIPGWGSMLLFVPERRFAVAVLGNGLAPLAQASYCVASSVLHLAIGAPPDITTDSSLWGGFTGTYRGLDVLHRPFTAQVALSHGKLMATITGLGAHVPLTFPLEQRDPDVFLLDSNGDGVADLDITFVRSGGSGAITRWLRNRQFVGERVGRTRRRLE